MLHREPVAARRPGLSIQVRQNLPTETRPLGLGDGHHPHRARRAGVGHGEAFGNLQNFRPIAAPAFVEHRRRPHQRQPRHRQRDCPSSRTDRFPPPPPPDPRAGGNPPTPPCACRAPAWRRPDRARVGLPQNRRRCREPPGHVVRVPQFRPPAGLRPGTRVLPPPPRTRGRRPRRDDAARRRRVTKDLIHHRQHRRPRPARFVGPPLRDHRLPPAFVAFENLAGQRRGPAPPPKNPLRHITHVEEAPPARRVLHRLVEQAAQHAPRRLARVLKFVPRPWSNFASRRPSISSRASPAAGPAARSRVSRGPSPSGNSRRRTSANVSRPARRAGRSPPMAPRHAAPVRPLAAPAHSPENRPRRPPPPRRSAVGPPPTPPGTALFARPRAAPTSRCAPADRVKTPRETPPDRASPHAPPAPPPTAGPIAAPAPLPHEPAGKIERPATRPRAKRPLAPAADGPAIENDGGQGCCRSGKPRPPHDERPEVTPPSRVRRPRRFHCSRLPPAYKNQNPATRSSAGSGEKRGPPASAGADHSAGRLTSRRRSSRSWPWRGKRRSCGRRPT